MEKDVKVFDEKDASIQQDIMRLILQYLENEGFNGTVPILAEESGITSSKVSQQQFQNVQKRMTKAILDGDWNEAERICLKLNFKYQKNFLYLLHRQVYFELLESSETEKAYNYLNKMLKPLENRHSNPAEFKDLCYLLTCKTIQEVPEFSKIDSKKTGRELLVQKFESMLRVDTSLHETTSSFSPHRLVDLLKQATTFQIEQEKQHFENPKLAPKINTLMEDFHSLLFPNQCFMTLRGHKENVKCMHFIESKDDLLLASGSSDNTVKLWSCTTGNNLTTFTGHASRIWDLSFNKQNNILCSVSGDSSIKLWSIEKKKQVKSWEGIHAGDIYTVQFHPGQDYIVTGGYDKSIAMVDVQTGTKIRNFVGHNSSVSRVIFNPSGNLIISGSKDCTIKFWDISSGLCIKTISAPLGEVTSLEISTNGTLLLSGSKDNSNRLWDTRSAKPLSTYRGHQNTSKNFVRSAFAADEQLIVGGSEDGNVYIWDLETGHVLEKLKGHRGVVSSAIWKEWNNSPIIASCSQDDTIKLWNSPRRTTPTQSPQLQLHQPSSQPQQPQPPQVG